MQLHSFARYISSSILSSFGFMVVWKCFLSLSFFKFYVFLFNFYFSIVNNLCRGSELSRDPWSSVCDVRLFLLLLWLLVGCRFSLRRSEGILFSRLIWLMSFCAENVYLGVSFKLREIFGLFVHVHLQNYGLAFLISSTEKMEVTACHWNGKSGDTPHCAICSSN